MTKKAPRILKCIRCGYEWTPFVRKPKQCPNCRNIYWNKPYVRRLRRVVVTRGQYAKKG